MDTLANSPWLSADASRISPVIYCDPDIYELEQQTIFSRCWQFVGMESQVRNPGDYFLSKIGDESVIVSRGNDGRVHVMLNVCRHRGYQLCQAERGNVARFTCPFHAWSFGTDGRLLHVPLAESLCPDIDRDEFGLIRLPRVEIYRGLIFASFDASAVPLTEALGDFLFYLDTFVGRRRCDLEMIGGIHRWEVESNWKLGPDGMGGDFYHTPSTHASTSPVMREALKLMCDPSFAHNVSVDGGHGCNVLVMPEGLPEESYYPVEPRFLEIPEVRQYFAAIHEETRQQLGDLRTRVRITTGTLFPNLSLSPGIFTLRLTVPKGPGKLENWCWVLGYPDMPPEVRNALYSAYLSVFGPDGCLEPDDAEAWALVTEGTRSRHARRHPLFAGLGLNQEWDDPVLPGKHHHPMSEGVSRNFYIQWHEQIRGTRHG